jgi:ribosomal protein S18 acetylase RimI-like enzyme
LVALDTARTADDYRQCAEILTKTHPNDLLPDFTDPHSITFIIFDAGDRSKVRGCIHTQVGPEVCCLAVDPDYRFQDASRAMLHQFSDAHFRTQNFRAVVHTVPKSNDQVRSMLKKSGAVEINKDDVRLRMAL